MSSPSSATPSSSASAIVAGATSGYHVLKIKGYSFIKSAFPNGKHIDSRPFRMAGHTWAIKYYPNGSTPAAADHVSLFLLLCNPGEAALMVKLMFSLIDEVEKQAPSYVGARTPCRFAAHSDDWGFEKFMKKDVLEQSSEHFNVDDDSFTVRCDMVVVVAGKIHAAEDVVPAVCRPPSPAPPPDWPRHFQALLRSGQGADVRFRVEGRTFAAHRCVLAARSPVFSAELYGGMKESVATGVAVEIRDVGSDVFGSLLHFVYTDSLPEQTEEEDASMAPHLLVAADRYDMERLKVICEEKLCHRIEVSTAGNMLVLAEQHGCRRLKEACFEFLKTPKTLDAVVATDGFQGLAKSFPFLLFELIATLGAAR
ncbi:unnamed protein product [Urochloa decumbens]|uniref:Uncharacterized protein n=1 Tax=Urochloa decumbens TaxID=240449 RepID=A0ABC8XJC1_9POAL